MRCRTITLFTAVLLFGCGSAASPRLDAIGQAASAQSTETDSSKQSSELPDEGPRDEGDTPVGGKSTESAYDKNQLADMANFTSEEAIDHAENTSIEKAVELYSAFDAGVPIASSLALRIALQAAHQRDWTEARLWLNRISSPGEINQRRDELLRFIPPIRTAARSRIGVLLPLSGPYRGIGKSILAGIEMALEGRKAELVVLDTQGLEDLVPELVRQLVHDHQVAVILGPVGQRESQRAASEAQRLEQTLITFSSDFEVPRLGTHIFQHRLPRQEIASRLARHAVQSMGLRRFAILYPASVSGRQSMTAFWKAVERHGGTIKGAEAYSTNDKDYSTPIKKLIGRFHLDDTTPDEYWQQLNRKAKDPAFFIPPTVEFDALYIPDSGRRLRNLLPYLSYWDIELKTSADLSPTTLAPKYGGEPPTLVQLLGGPGFYDAGLTQKNASQVQNSVFLRAYWPGNDKASEFDAVWRTRHRRKPPALAAHAFDAAQIVLRALAGRRPDASFNQALVDVTDHEGLFGPSSFDSAGRLNIPASVLVHDPVDGIRPYDAVTLRPRRGQPGQDEDRP